MATYLDKPEVEWCDYDYLACYIIEVAKYEPVTSLDNLMAIVLFNYDGYLAENGQSFYAIEDDRPYPDKLMINTEDVAAFVYDAGGWREFDYLT